MCIPGSVKRAILFIGVMAGVLAGGWPGASAQTSPPPDLTTVGLEAVMDMEVSSVSKKPERLVDTPAAVTVITAAEIRRSGAQSLPELLRLVPGVQVARINSNEWAVGVRGFTSALSRSLLVLIDGRSVYSPLFAGVYWDTQDVLLEDIERIEVIRGPGSTVWGANAVNGVINVITRSAQRSQGNFISMSGGNEERLRVAARSGYETSSGIGIRSYLKYFDRSAEYHGDGDEFDGWHMTRAGVRADADPKERDHLTLQASAYDGAVGDRSTLSDYSAPYTRTVREDSDLWGGDLMGQWRHRTERGSSFELDFYYDLTHRAQPGFSEDRNTIDFEFRHQGRLGQRNAIIWGAGYRRTAGNTDSTSTIQFVPEDRTDDLVSAFVLDQMEIVPSRLTLTVGSKFEHNDYSGFDYQPSLRLLATPTPTQSLWCGVSKALRVPSRIEEDFSATGLLEPSTPTFIRVLGTKDFEPERLIAYELGYRVQPKSWLFVDLALFYNDYAHLLSLEPGTPFFETTPAPPHAVVPLFLGNGMKAQTRGAELAVEWKPRETLRFTGAYAYLDLDLTPDDDSQDTSTEPSTEGSSPRHTASLRSSIDLPRKIDLDVTLRRVGSLPSQSVDAYTEMDLVIRHFLPGGLEASLAGNNLLSSRHAEFAGGRPGSIEIRRSLYAQVVWRW